MAFLWELRIAGPDVAIRTILNDFIDDDIGLFAQFEGTLAPHIFMLENTLDKQVLEVFQTGESPKSYSALRNPVVGVKSVEWIPVLLIKTDTVVDDCETLNRRLAALKFLLVRPSSEDIDAAFLDGCGFYGLDRVHDGFDRRSVDVCSGSNVLDGSFVVDVAHSLSHSETPWTASDRKSDVNKLPSLTIWLLKSKLP